MTQLWKLSLVGRKGKKYIFTPIMGTKDLRQIKVEIVQEMRT